MSQQGLLTDATSAGADIEALTPDVGGAIGPDAAFNVNLLGTAAQGISTSGAGNTITWTIADATEAQKGVSELATDAETIAGADAARTIVPSALTAKLGTQTANGLPIGAGTAAAIAWTAAPTNGQILVGSTGVSPSLTTITAGDGITVTNGAGSVTITNENTTTSTGQTIGAVTADLFTLALGATPTCYRFFVMISGFDSAGANSYGYTLDGTLETDGAAASVIQTVNRDADEDDVAAQATIVASGNNAIVRVTGVAGQTINWKTRTQYINTL